MSCPRHQSSGFALIASLLLLLLLSGIAIGLMMMVNTEARVGGSNLQNNAAYHAAEGGIEKMSSDLAATFQSAQAPTASQICNLSTLQPAIGGVTWKDYSVEPRSGCTAPLQANFGQITAGPNQGLWAQIIPVSMLATAAEPGGQEVSMTRQMQMALIPVFQFGVFCDGDCSFFSGPNFDFAGRVHVNQDLYPFVGPGSTLKFHDKVTVYGNVVRTMLANGLPPGSQYNGTVDIPTAAQGCDGAPPLPACRALGLTEGSVTGAGGNPPLSGQNGGWPTLSLSTYNGEIIDGNYGNPGGTGAKKLSLPFVSGTTHPYEIIRRPSAGESPSSSLAQSREYNMAQIRVLLTDDPAELPGGATDTANNIRLANVTGAAPINPYGIPTSVPAGLAVLPAGSTYNLYFAQSWNGIPDETPCNGTNCTTATLSPDWPYAPATPVAAAQTLVPAGAPIMAGTNTTPPPTINLCPPGSVAAANLPAGCTGAYPYYSAQGATTAWNLIDGWLRVEYRDAAGDWHPVTMEWLQLGFARDVTPPTTPGGNTVNPNAILLLQQPAARDAGSIVAGTVSINGIAPSCTAMVSGVCTAWTNPLPPEVLEDTQGTTPWQFGVTSSSTASQSVTRFNWYPINLYDAREGEARDVNQGNNSCTANGVMNAVELDVGNLKAWLSGQIGSSGTSVDYLAQNGYVLYFSDRRGMLRDPNPPHANTKTGDSGLEDVINASSAAGTPNGALETPEDVNQNGWLDNFGAANLGLGFYNGATNINGQIVLATPNNPYNPRIASCGTTARKNWVSGARHVLKLVDGSLGNLPLRTDPGNVNTGGFTVASENPVYIQGDYNSNSADPTWSGNPDQLGHAAAAVIADAVTLLSNNWDDRRSLLGNPSGGTNSVTDPNNRRAATTYYRVAVAGGKNLNFPRPSWGAQDFGTDGGVHNFLRYIENWGGFTLNYKGSLVNLYYSTYNTGIFKCCTSVYSPPTRNYFFDSDFALPQGLPPGTPLFKDIDSLGYRQLFTARTN
jgi:Tfp pilus assembly protein PilX